MTSRVGNEKDEQEEDEEERIMNNLGQPGHVANSPVMKYSQGYD